MVKILILGAGWTSTFLISQCKSEGIEVASTSRSGRDNTIPFEFDPDSDDVEPYKSLPTADTVLITFPIVKSGGATRLVKLYNESRSDSSKKASFIQFGTTSMWGGTTHGSNRTTKFDHQWYDRHSPYNKTDRANAEDELLSLSSDYPSTVLNLVGLWGGSRGPWNWVDRVAPTKDILKDKGSLHLVHGDDVARAVVSVHSQFDKANGQRWLLSDCRVYDWWDLASALASSSDSVEEPRPQPQWVRELMREQNVRSLPRDVSCLGRALDGRDFWMEFGLSPNKPLLAFPK